MKVISRSTRHRRQAVFVGITGAVGATRAAIDAVQGNGWFTIDDLQVDAASVAAAIPAPAGLSILLLGAPYLRRRR